MRTHPDDRVARRLPAKEPSRTAAAAAHGAPRLAAASAASLLMLAAAAAIPAQPPPPVSLGPLGGTAASVAIDPLDPSVMLVIKYTQGLFRSVDGGVTFAPFGTGISPSVVRLTVDPRDGRTLFVLDGNRVHRSADFGATWSALGLNAENDLNEIAVAGAGSGLLALDAFVVYHSADEGATWTEAASTVPFGGEVFDSVAYAPSDPSIAYFGSTDGVYKSTDGGRSFTDPGPFQRWAQALSVAPQDPDVVLSGSNAGIFRSLDGGATFASIDTGLPPVPNAEFFAWEPDGSVLWLALLEGVWMSTNFGTVWTDANAGFPSLRPIPTDLAFDGQGGRVLAAESNSLHGTAGGGIYRRPSPAQPWQHFGFLEVLIADAQIATPGGLRLAATGSGVFSAAPGQPLVATAFEAGIGAATQVIAVDPVDATRWIAGGVGAFIDNAQIFVLTGSGSGFVKTYERFGAGRVEDLAFDPGNPQRVVAGMFPAGFGTAAIVVSANRGQTWSDVGGTAGWATRAVAFDPHTPGRVLQLSDDNRWAESRSSGTKWTPLRPAWPATGSAVLLEFDPFAAGVLYRGDTGMGLWRSDNGGASWTPLGISLDGESDLVLHPQFAGLLWVGDAQGAVWVSGDRGQTFVKALDIPSGSPASGLAIDTASGALLLGTAAASAWELPAASPFVRLGAGTAGTGGFVPRHVPTGGLPRLGNGAFGLAADRLRGGAPVLLALGVAPASVPLFGGTLFTVPALVLPLGVAGGTPGQGGAGAIALPLPLPRTASLAGATLISQLLAVDSGALHPSGVVLSDPLRTVLLP